jgi:hypothetical protein
VVQLRQNMGKKSRARRDKRRQLARAGAPELGCDNSSVSKKGNILSRLSIPFRYFARIGLGGIMFGLASVVLGLLGFWWAVGVVYLFAAVYLLSIWFEKSPRVWMRYVAAIIVLTFLIFFSLKVVFVPCPIEIKTFAINGDYAPGKVIGEIPWRADFVDLRVIINNASDYDYQDVDFVLNTDQQIAKIGQKESRIDCSIFPDDNIADVRHTGKKSDGTQTQIQFERALTSHYRVRCEKFPKRAFLQLVVATTDLRNEASVLLGQPLDHPKVKPRTVHIEGQCKCFAGKPLEVNFDRAVEDADSRQRKP